MKSRWPTALDGVAVRAGYRIWVRLLACRRLGLAVKKILRGYQRRVRSRGARPGRGEENAPAEVLKDLCACGGGDEPTLAVPCHVAAGVFGVINSPSELVDFW
jgi:hypothetical protein